VEAQMRARFAGIGIEVGKPFAVDKLTPEQKAELKAGMKNGIEKIKQQVATFGTDENGWRVTLDGFGDRKAYAGHWLERAAAAMAGIYGNSPAEAVYPLLAADSGGNKVDTRANRYTVTFPAGALPPVNAFWSVTMYDGKSQLLIANPIDRYLINSPMLPSLKTNSDGSLTLYLQKDTPGADKVSNWLPAPDGPPYLVMRLDWPKADLPSIYYGTWKPPAVQRVK
jgi:hypothetical protein